jgi:hypothetical protein
MVGGASFLRSRLGLRGGHSCASRAVNQRRPPSRVHRPTCRPDSCFPLASTSAAPLSLTAEAAPGKLNPRSRAPASLRDRPSTKVIFTLNGETGKSVSQYSKQWLELVPEVRSLGATQWAQGGLPRIPPEAAPGPADRQHRPWCSGPAARAPPPQRSKPPRGGLSRSCRCPRPLHVPTAQPPPHACGLTPPFVHHLKFPPGPQLADGRGSPAAAKREHCRFPKLQQAVRAWAAPRAHARAIACSSFPRG